MSFSSGWTGTLVVSSGGTSWASGGMHSGCGLSPCGGEELIVLGVTAAVCELLLTVTSCGWLTELFVGGTGELRDVDWYRKPTPATRFATECSSGGGSRWICWAVGGFSDCLLAVSPLVDGADWTLFGFGPELMVEDLTTSPRVVRPLCPWAHSSCVVELVVWVSLQVGPLLGWPFPAVVRGLPLYSSSRRVDVVSSAVTRGRLVVALSEQDGALWAAETNRSAIASSIRGHGRSRVHARDI